MAACCARPATENQVRGYVVATSGSTQHVAGVQGSGYSAHDAAVSGHMGAAHSLRVTDTAEGFRVSRQMSTVTRTSARAGSPYRFSASCLTTWASSRQMIPVRLSSRGRISFVTSGRTMGWRGALLSSPFAP